MVNYNEMKNNEHIEIFKHIIKEIEQHCIEKNNLGEKIFKNLYYEYNEHNEKSMNQIKKIFIQGSKYIFLLCNDMNEPIFLIFLDEYIGHDIEYICEEIKYDDNKNYFGPKMIYFIVRLIVNHYIGWYGLKLNYYLYTIDESFNFNKLVEIINHVILNYYSNSNEYDYIRITNSKKINKSNIFYNYFTLTNIDSMKYPKLCFTLVDTLATKYDNIMENKNKIDKYEIDEKMNEILQINVYDKSNTNEMIQTKIIKKNFIFNYTVIK